MTWRNNTCDINYSPSLITFLQIINSMKLTSFFLCFIIKMLDKRIIYTKCMYNCLYHVSSVGKGVSLRDANVSCLVSWKSRITTRREASSSDSPFPTDQTWYKQLYIHNVYIMCIYIRLKIKPNRVELDFWAFQFLFFPRRDLNSHHWYTAAPIA
jgi:hypothetical protein